jgi:hypothetical protein
MPGEEVKFHSKYGVHYGAKKYQVVVTDRRILLYASRGLFRNDDVVIQKFADLHGVRYQEEGIIEKKGIIKLQSPRAEMDLKGSATEVKALYQQMMQFM